MNNYQISISKYLFSNNTVFLFLAFHSFYILLWYIILLERIDFPLKVTALDCYIKY